MEKHLAYVDGSFNKESDEYGAGAILIHPNGKMESFLSSDVLYSDQRNVAGEILAVRLVVDAALERNIKQMEIFYDYQGIGAWADGRWNANTECTRSYTEYIRKARERMKITFTKVKAHSGDKYNELVDGLAKKAIGIYKKPSFNENGYKFYMVGRK